MDWQEGDGAGSGGHERRRDLSIPRIKTLISPRPAGKVEFRDCRFSLIL
jgi:hypothetical protein